jgi:hypothetical protein
VASAGRRKGRDVEIAASSGGATIEPASAITAAKTNAGVMNGMRPRTATRNRRSSSVSRTHSVAATASTTMEAILTAVLFAAGVMSSMMPAASSGHVHKYAAPGAAHSAPLARAIQRGSVRLQVTAGCLTPCARSGSHARSRAAPHPTRIPVISSRANNRSGRAYQG